MVDRLGETHRVQPAKPTPLPLGRKVVTTSYVHFLLLSLRDAGGKNLAKAS
jgi:hypothetical protein